MSILNHTTAALLLYSVHLSCLNLSYQCSCRSIKVVQRSIYNKEISDNAILSAASGDVVVSPDPDPGPMTQLRGYRTNHIILATTTTFLLAWLPCQLVPLLLQHLQLSCYKSYLITLSTLPLLASSVLNPTLYSRQNTEVTTTST